MLNVECLFILDILFIHISLGDILGFEYRIFLHYCDDVRSFSSTESVRAKWQRSSKNWKIQLVIPFLRKKSKRKEKIILIDFPIDSSYTATTAPIQLQGVTSAKENWTDKHPIEIEFNRRKIFQQPISYLNSLIDFSSIECLANGLFEQFENKRRKR